MILGLISVGIAATISFAFFYKPLRAAFVTIVASEARMRYKYSQKCENSNLLFSVDP
jgi:hypothetical protein